MKTAFITGVTGQDGSYLAEFLLGRGDYRVVGLVRRSSTPNTERLEHLPAFSETANSNLTLHYGDLADTASLVRLLEIVQPDEIYNLAAMSHVAASFDIPEYTADVDALGAVRLLEAIRVLGLKDKTRFYQASSSELFGLVQETPQRETTPFYPRSPYACAKLFAYWTTVNYREAYGLYAANGILFNHESPRRGVNFVTRKITRALSRIYLGLQECIYLGNLDARRDWGYASDYVEAQWLILQQPQPEDFVIATGEQYSVRDFVVAAARELGLEITWCGEGLQETGVDQHGRVIVRVDPGLFRPAEVDSLLGDSAKAKEKLGWRPRIGFAELIRDMMVADLAKARQESQRTVITAPPRIGAA